MGCVVAALALGIAACGDDSSDSGGSSAQAPAAKTLTIYSSVPLQGASRVQSEALVNGAKLALEQAGGKAGEHTITYESLDDSTAQAGSWTPEAESANALKAAQDKSTAVYLGTFNSGAAKISIPVLNEAGVPMISPANTYVGLTTNDPGSEPGEPDIYYPTGKRNYTRIVPKDTIQAAALVTLMKQDGCTKVAMANDKEVYGAGLARVIELSARIRALALDRQRRDRQERGQLPLAGGEGQGGGRRLLRVRRHHGQQRRAAVQGLRGGAAGREALRAGRRRRDRLRVREGRRHPGGPRPAREADGRDAVAGRVPAGGAGVLQGVHREVRRHRTRTRTRSTATRRCRSRWTRSSAPGPASAPTSRRRCSRPRTARACWARTRSTPTATRR